ncbi:MAG: beta-galactosidase trimerization domain-containing protein [Acidobacteriaceae bacterium]
MSKKKNDVSRRGFLRSAVASAMLSPTMIGIAQSAAHSRETAAEALPTGPDAMVLGRIKLDRELANQSGVLSGSLRFLRAVSGPVVVRWFDSFGRVSGEQKLATTSTTVTAPFSFNMQAGLTYVNWIRVTVNGVPQVATAKFMLSPEPTPWNDFHTISWAHYPDGFYEQLRSVGMDGIIAYVNDDFEPILDNDFRYYVEQMAWEVFSIYHKGQTLWRTLLAKFSLDRANLDLWVRHPCVNDPATTEYLHEHITRFARTYGPFRPLFYNIADELGQGDQIRPNDFCHSKFCKEKFAGYLRALYRVPPDVSREWGVGEFTHWDDTVLNAFPAWDKNESMISYTTTDRAFEAVALAGLKARYKTIGNFNQQWGTGFPVPRGNTVMPDSWNPILGVARESLSVPVLDDASLEKAMGPLDQANARWGGLGSWDAPNKPTTFKTWREVAAFIERYFKELGEITSTRHWDVAPWCDFRNFMDQTFADAVKRAGDICKAEDPYALCSTEGGQCPFAYGWYNYENVVRAIDVIEPYNIGNNVEVIRSLNPKTIMISTHGFGGFRGKPGQPLSEREQMEQKRAVRPIWWGLFHRHLAALIWDDNEKGNEFVDMSTGQLTISAETFSGIFHELRAGIGKLTINSKRKHDGIAIHYSQPSIQVHWLLDNLKHAREWMLKSGGDSDSVGVAVRNSWTKLIEDLALQYNFVGSQRIEAGDLNSGEYKVFVMPQSIAVSPAEAAQIRAFVQAGGTLIADCRAAELDGHGRDIWGEKVAGYFPANGNADLHVHGDFGGGQLDDVFGIAHGPAQTAAKPVQGTGNDGALQLEGKSLNELQPADVTVVAVAGKALAHSGDVPLVIVNQYGAGRAIFLNLQVADYAYLRLKADSNTSLPELMESVFELAGIKPQVRVLGPDGKRVPGTEIVRFANGNCEQVAIFRNPQTDNGGWGAYPKLLADSSIPVIDPNLIGDIDNSLLEKTVDVSIEWTDAAQTYDVRGRKDLGKIGTLKASFNWWSPIVFTRSQQALPALRVNIKNARAGEMAEIVISGEGALPDDTFRVVHLEFRTPSGEQYELYARNVLMQSSPYVERVPLAVNDPRGNWKVVSHDLMTGQVVETPFTLLD